MRAEVEFHPTSLHPDELQGVTAEKAREWIIGCGVEEDGTIVGPVRGDGSIFLWHRGGSETLYYGGGLYFVTGGSLLDDPDLQGI